MNTQEVVKPEPNRALTQSYVKPLTMEQQILVDVLTHRFEGVSDLFAKVETPDSITLSIPRLQHIVGSRV